MRALIVLAGLLLGALAGAGLVLANPLAWLRGLPPLPADLAPAKVYRWDAYRGMAGNVADLLGVPRRSPGFDLTDPALRHVRVGILVLPGGQGLPAALAVKVSAIAAGNALWRAQLGTDDAWNIFWPGEGSVFASGYSNFWGVARDTFFAKIPGSGQERLAGGYALSEPSPQGDSPVVTGASGRYAGFAGEIRELLYPAAPASVPAEPDWAIAVRANPPPVSPR